MQNDSLVFTNKDIVYIVNRFKSLGMTADTRGTAYPFQVPKDKYSGYNNGYRQFGQVGGGLSGRTTLSMRGRLEWATD